MSERPEAVSDGVKMHWGLQIPMRDGVCLSATLYLPSAAAKPSPVILSLTPYVAQSLHEYGLYFAAHGYPFVAVDVRGRGNSEGTFKPFVHDGRDGHDAVEWLAHQPYCNGQVATWGGSYGGFTQWALAKEFPPHLATIAPAASVHPGVDFPIYNNIVKPYTMRWLTFVAGRGLQDKIFGDLPFWSRRFKEWFESGASFSALDRFLGHPSATFQEWLQHPEQDSHWQQYNPTSEQYARLAVPVLTITGQYDGDQPGALTHYRQHRKHAPSARHCLVIGPWDHPGTRDPKAEFGGMRMGPQSLVDLGKLHLQWYEWTMQGGARPEFLRKDVAYYVIGADEWRYADSLEQITAQPQALYLQSSCNPTDVFASGALSRELSSGREFDRYIYDPRDVSLAALESTVDPNNAADQRMVHARRGTQLIYHSAPFERDVEICGFFKLQLWISIDQPDTDFRASVYEIALDGSSVLLASDSIRARYRESLREARLIDTSEPLRYDFERFMFVARRVKARHRLRLVIGPIHSIYSQRNCNTGRPVAEESLADAQPVTVSLFHDESHPSVLYIPFGSG
jgi:hypothetical protein